MRAMDVMTTDVITVDPDMSVQAVAQLLSERGISGVPVVDAANRLVGIISEGDLLHRVETGTERRPQQCAQPARPHHDLICFEVMRNPDDRLGNRAQLGSCLEFDRSLAT